MDRDGGQAGAMAKAPLASPKGDPAWWAPSTLEIVFTIFTAMVGCVTGFMSMVSVLPPNSVQLFLQPYTSTASLPHAVVVNGVLTAAYSDCADPTDTTTACGGACLLDPFNADATASCGLGAGTPIDHFIQLFYRTVVFQSGKLVTADEDLGLPFGVRICTAVACGVVGLLSALVLLIHPRTVFRNQQAIPQRDVWFHLPMFNVVRGFISVFAF